MAQSSALTPADLELIPKEEIKEEIEVDVPVEFVSCDPQECVLCVSQTSESLNIFKVHTNTSGTPLHAFLSKFTNTELPYSPNLLKYICKACFDLVNNLERAELDKNDVQYDKLKKCFQLIISKNPFFYLPQSRVKSEPLADCDNDCLKLSEDVKKEKLKKKYNLRKLNSNDGKPSDVAAVDLSQINDHNNINLGQEIINKVKKTMENMLTGLATLAKDITDKEIEDILNESEVEDFAPSDEDVGDPEFQPAISPECESSDSSSSENDQHLVRGRGCGRGRGGGRSRRQGNVRNRRGREI